MKKRMRYMRKQMFFYFIKNIFYFPIWFVRFLTPSFFKGSPNIWTNLKMIFTHKQFRPLRMGMLAWVFFVFLLIEGGIYVVKNSPPTFAATYTWIQTDWSSGVDVGQTASHDSNRTGWAYFYSKDSGVTVGTELNLSIVSTSTLQTNDTDFGAGTAASTTVSGSGSDASVGLSSSYLSSLSVLASSTVLSTYNDIDVSGNYAYVAQGNSGYDIWDISDPANPSLEVDTNITPSPEEVVVSGNYAYFAVGPSGLYILDITNPTSPVEVTTYTGNSWIYHLAISDNYIYGTGASSLEIIDISDPTSPTSTASYNVAQFPSDVYVSGNYAYVAQTDAGIEVVDISDPLAPVQAGVHDTAYARGVAAVSGSYAYVADNTELEIVDISNLGAMSRTKSVGTTAAQSVELDGDYAFVSAYNSGLQVVDVSDASTASVYGSVTTAKALDADISGAYIYMASDGLQIVQIKGFETSGTFTSEIIDTTFNLGFDNMSWTSSVPTNTTLTMKVRTSDDSGMSGATAWGSCDAVTSGNDISSNNCVTDTHRYVQYQATLASTDSTVSPTLSDVTIGHNSYPLEHALISSPFDTGNAANVVGDIAWSETTPSGTDVKFQIRTSADNATWTGWSGPTDSSDYYTTPGGSNTVTSTHSDGSGDQWVQYQALLVSDGSDTPTLSDLTFTYVVNSAPDFETAPSSTQRTSDGYVVIEYSVRDTDTAGSGVNCPNCITPSFEYSTNGSSWTSITSGLSENATSTKTVGTSEYTDYSLTWDATTQLDGTYSTTTYIRVTADDLEGASNTVVSSTAAFTLDTKDPVLGSTSTIVIATTTPASLTLDVTDDSSIEMKISLNPDLTGGTWETYGSSSTVSLATDPDTVYVQFRDAYKNETAIQNATTPETPGDIIIRDISNADSGDYKMFTSWRAVETSLSDFQKYTVWSSTDGVTYSELTTVDDRGVNFHVHSDLSNGDTLYYKVTNMDNDGNTSYFSSIVNDAANGQGGTDTTAPTISNIATSSISTQGATITWDTDELSNSTVGYSTNAATFTSETGVATMLDSSSESGQHSVSLTGLTPNTLYYFKTISIDPSSNTASSTNGGDGYTFTTLDGASISGVAVDSTQNTSAVITWNTDIAAESSVFYSVNSDMSSAIEISSATEVTEHTISLTGLIAGTEYYFYVTSGVASDTNASSYYTFTTTNDSSAPTFSTVTTTLVTDDDAIFTWTTNEAATSKLEYGTSSGSYTTSTSENSSLDINHVVSISDLLNNTTYYYHVISADGSGNRATSTEYSFTTLEILTEESEVVLRENAAEESGEESVVCSGGGGGTTIIIEGDTVAPAILNTSIGDITASTAQFFWETDEMGDSIVEFGKTNALGDIAGTFDIVSNHEVTLNDLTSGSQYYYRVTTADDSGNRAMSDQKTFSTESGVDDLFLDEGTILPREDLSGSENVFLTAMRKTAAFIKSMSSQVSVSTLENGLETQQNIMKELSELVPTPLIGGQPVVTVDATNVEIFWTTDKEANSLVAFSPAYIYEQTREYNQTVGDPNIETTEHSVKINELRPATTYHYQVMSKTSVSDFTKSPDFIFTTRDEENDIRSYQMNTSEEGVVDVVWETVRPTDSLITYTPYRDGELVMAETRSIYEKGLTMKHQIPVDDFESGLIYQIELSGEDSGGTTIRKVIETYSTEGVDIAPFISRVKTDTALLPGDESRVQVVISWDTNELSTGQVFYQKGFGSTEELKDQTSLVSGYTKNHIIVITNFDPGSVYQFQVESVDISGNAARSKTYTILTPRQKESVLQVIMNNMEDTFSWVSKLKGD
ncbi:hypothetical protein C0581_03340 [Candidatus Parcubacteria bacterium]|nr:MAG: hypothetical protein C0581_03340 [Candidatus Parcubacteria bacterium]